MRINVNVSKRTQDRQSDLIGLIALAGEFYVFLSLIRAHDWFVGIVPSEAMWSVACAVVYLILAIWALYIWPRFHRKSQLLIWTACFAAVGTCFFYLGTVLKYGQRFSIAYAAGFLGQAMIGAAGMARLLWANHKKRMAGTNDFQ